MDAYGRWPLTRIEPQVVSSEKRSRGIFSVAEKSLHAISKFRKRVSFVLVFFVTLSGVVHAVTRDHIMRKVVAYESTQTILKTTKSSGQKEVVAVAPVRWLFQRKILITGI